MLTCSTHVIAGDSLEVQQTKFEKRLERKQNAWLSLIPTHFVIQNAGNMGTLSAGIGWSYGKSRKWETELLVGFIPKHDSSRPKITRPASISTPSMDMSSGRASQAAIPMAIISLCQPSSV